ncbi:hypothetical protein [Streptomyces sp.]|uniref:hypothetical protein n=1 Tax=Streptomyces sp. TaxID=1931 RepID=UPI002F405406
MPAGVYEGALEDPATRKWCERRRSSAQVLLGASVAMLLPGWAVVLFLADQAGWITFSALLAAPPVVLTIVTLVYCDLRLGRIKRYQHILAVYPWQKHKGVLFMADNGEVYLRIADPEHPNKSVSVRIRRPGIRRWLRLAQTYPEQEVWFAGDPRIGGALALPGPARLSLARQGGAAGRADAVEARRNGNSLRGVSEEALQRALAAGFDQDFDHLDPRLRR